MLWWQWPIISIKPQHTSHIFNSKNSIKLEIFMDPYTKLLETSYRHAQHTHLFFDYIFPIKTSIKKDAVIIHQFFLDSFNHNGYIYWINGKWKFTFIVIHNYGWVSDQNSFSKRKKNEKKKCFQSFVYLRQNHFD